MRGECLTGVTMRGQVCCRGTARSGVLLRFDLFCLLLYAHATLASVSPVPLSSPQAHPKECISISEELCPTHAAACPCRSLPLSPMRGMAGEDSSPTVISLLCCHLASAVELWTGIECAGASTEGSGHIALHIWNSTLQGLAESLEASPKRPSLSSLTVTHSEIFPDDMGHGPLTAMASMVACLNLSSNGMGNLPPGALTGLSQLRALDLSHNNITLLPDLPPHVTTGQMSLWVDISGNEKLSCLGIKEAMSWNASVPINDLSPRVVLSNSSSSTHNSIDQITVNASSLPPPADRLEVQLPPVVFHNKEHTYCITFVKEIWFNWSERISLGKIEYAIKLECPRGNGYTCYCSILRYEQSEFSVAVDCSGRGLTELPANLPNNTVSLNVTNNKITTLEAFGHESYSKVREFYADNNEITSIQALEGTHFLINFQHLHLSGNKLTNLPLYVLNKMFDENSQVIHYLKLGRNEYHCDCNTWNGLKEWILRNKKQVTDHEEMRCDSEVHNTKIIDLRSDAVCIQKDWKDYLSIVVLAEVLLLIIIVSKVSYDYWIFKTKGYLPWPASQTPKLPCCDWAFDA